MAQRLIHVLMAEQLLDDGISDRNRFMLGSIIPDAYGKNAGAIGQSRFDAQARTHFTKSRDNGTWRYFDFAEFYERFAQRVRTDDLYLGYYMHIFEDACYRKYCHRELALPRMTFDRVRIMHADYHLLNAYIMKQYKLSGDIRKTPDFEREELNELFTFDVDGFLEELAEDMAEHPEGQTTFLTENALDTFIEQYMPLCADALKRARNGAAPPAPTAFGWSLLDK